METNALDPAYVHKILYCKVVCSSTERGKRAWSVKGGVILGHGAEQECTTGASVFSDHVIPMRWVRESL